MFSHGPAGIKAGGRSNRSSKQQQQHNEWMRWSMSGGTKFWDDVVTFRLECVKCDFGFFGVSFSD